jgi:carboxyl-terminal processing protease
MVFDLPRGWRISIATHASWSAQRMLFKDTPLTPDIRTQWTRDDMCSARDPDMTAALQLLAQL